MESKKKMSVHLNAMKILSLLFIINSKFIYGSIQSNNENNHQIETCSDTFCDLN